MNKIKTWTYLYKEIILNLKNFGLKDIAILKNDNEIVYGVNENLLYMIEPYLNENTKVYTNFFINNWLYILYSDQKEREIYGKKYVGVLEIGRKYKVYVLINKDIATEMLNYMITYISIMIADEIVINKVKNIKKGIEVLDIILNNGKDVYAIPGDIFDYKNYLSNFAIKQGAIPICGIYDIKYILLQKHYKKN